MSLALGNEVWVLKGLGLSRSWPGKLQIALGFSQTCVCAYLPPLHHAIQGLDPRRVFGWGGRGKPLAGHLHFTFLPIFLSSEHQRAFMLHFCLTVISHSSFPAP